MKRLAMVLLTGVLAAAAGRCEGETACTEVAVLASVGAEGGELTLADLLGPDTCERLRRAATQISLGSVPAGGFVRVLGGDQIRELLEELAGGSLKLKKTLWMQIPERVTVRRAGTIKSCAEFAEFVANAAPTPEAANALGPWQDRMDCAAAPSIPEDTPLELLKTTWSTGLHRWEFAVRCARPEDCVPFLLWFREENTPPARLAGLPSEAVQRVSFLAARASKAGGSDAKPLVKRGQTATLTWDQSGIRVVVPVICLDSGALGEIVRVRLKNAPRILRAEVTGAGTLRASL